MTLRDKICREMMPSMRTLVVAGLLFACSALGQQEDAQQAEYDSKLVGTWTTKSQRVITGPSFYNPVAEKLIEPDLTGISYSFTQDGWYESAWYRAIANPKTPQCPSGMMQWQHGTYIMYTNGSIVLTPIAIDGRQLISSPCRYKNSIYTRYNQTEIFQKYEVIVDPYHNVQRLNLFSFDGSPRNPMYIHAQPPVMLPTQTLNPTATSTATGAARATNKIKRAFGFQLADHEDEIIIPMNRDALKKRMDSQINPDNWWWIGVALTAIGGITYTCF